MEGSMLSRNSPYQLSTITEQLGFCFCAHIFEQIIEQKCHKRKGYRRIAQTNKLLWYHLYLVKNLIPIIFITLPMSLMLKLQRYE